MMPPGAPPPDEADFPAMRESLALLERFYDELNGDLESTNTRAGVALTLVAALTGIVLFQTRILTVAELKDLGPLEPLALLAGFCGYVLLLLGGGFLLRCLRLRTAESPYNVGELATQPPPYFRNAVFFYSRQLAYHRHAIRDRVKLSNDKGKAFTWGLRLSVAGFLLLVGLKTVGFIVGIVSTHG